MFWIDIVGISGSVAVAISFFPQVYHSLKKKTTQGVSIQFILIILYASVTMNIYSFYYEIIPMIIANVCVFINSLVLLYLYLNEHKTCGYSQSEEKITLELEFA